MARRTGPSSNPGAGTKTSPGAGSKTSGGKGPTLRVTPKRGERISTKRNTQVSDGVRAAAKRAGEGVRREAQRANLERAYDERMNSALRSGATQAAMETVRDGMSAVSGRAASRYSQEANSDSGKYMMKVETKTKPREKSMLKTETRFKPK